MELQKASMWKRISAWMFDSILLVVLAVLFGFCLSAFLNYDAHSAALDDVYEKYESQYGIQFDITQEAYEALSEQERAKYDEASEALTEDDEANYIYNIVVNLTLIITSLGLLLAVAVMEFTIPLCLKNGQTLGKKIFGVALVRVDGVKINTMQLFVRTLLGKYTVGTMVPVLICIMLIFGVAGLFGTLLLFGILLAQLLCLLLTRNKVGLADLMAGTVPVELNSQRIFSSTEELIEYTKKIHAERAARQDY